MPRTKTSRACKRCNQRKIRCNKERPCQSCLHFGDASACCSESDLNPSGQKDGNTPQSTNESLESIFSQGLDTIVGHRKTDKAFLEASTSKSGDKVLPPLHVVHALQDVLTEGKFIWHWPYIDKVILEQVIQRLFSNSSGPGLVECSFLNSALSALSALLPLAHPLRKQYSADLSKEARLRYTSHALGLLSHKDYYAGAVEDSVLMLECMTYHFLWWSSTVEMRLKEATYYCEQSFVSANMMDLFSEAATRASHIAQARPFDHSCDLGISKICLAVDLHFSRARTNLMRPDSISDTEFGCLVDAQKAIESSATLSVDFKELFAFRVDFIMKFYQTRVSLSQIDGCIGSHNKILLCRSLLDWLDEQDQAFVNTIDKNFFQSKPVLPDDKADNIRQNSNDPEDYCSSKKLQRKFCFLSNRVWTECYLFRYMLSLPSMLVDSNFLLQAFASSRSLLDEAGNWSSLIRSGWLHPPLRSVATIYYEAPLRLISLLLNRPEFALAALPAVNENSKKPSFSDVELLILSWLKMNFDTIFTILNNNFMHTPSLVTLAVAFQSVDPIALPRIPVVFATKAATSEFDVTKGHPHEFSDSEFTKGTVLTTSGTM